MNKKTNNYISMEVVVIFECIILHAGCAHIFVVVFSYRKNGRKDWKYASFLLKC